MAFRSVPGGQDTRTIPCIPACRSRKYWQASSNILERGPQSLATPATLLLVAFDGLTEAPKAPVVSSSCFYCCCVNFRSKNVSISHEDSDRGLNELSPSASGFVVHTAASRVRSGEAKLSALAGRARKRNETGRRPAVAHAVVRSLARASTWLRTDSSVICEASNRFRLSVLHNIYKKKFIIATSTVPDSRAQHLYYQKSHV